MAEQIPFGAVVNIIETLGSLAFREIARIYGVMEELEKLHTTIKLIQAALSDAEKRQQDDGDALVKAWILSLREVVHDAENLFDDLLIEQTRRKVKYHGCHGKVRVFFSSKNQLLFRRKMARKVQEIRNKFDDLSGDISKLNLVLSSGHIHNNLSERTWRDTDSFVLESDIVGREENKKEIIELLKQPNTNKNVSLIAIVGIGGLGKTALAQMIYNDADVKGLFKKMMWVCVSEDFEIKSILKQMLKSLEVAVDGFHLDQLQKKLREELNKQNYMLVLDDVWNESPLKWDALRKYLMCGCEGSKVLVTTRSKKVAQIMGMNYPYDLGGLTEEESWTLLKKVAFGDDSTRVSQNVESIGKGIAKKCAGVPLAIKTVGGLLRSNHEEAEWKRILDGDFWRLCEEKESIMPVLKLSYQNLPLELRQCFVYCCLYPKDSVIHSDELIQLWMAQGYLESSYENDRLEDVGNQYIKFLLMRSFFQEACLNERRDIESFKMHDLMHDLAKSIGGNDCCYLENGEEGIVDRPIHIALADSIYYLLYYSIDTSHLRTLVLKRMQDQVLIDQSLITSLKCLRALNLSRSSITQLPEFIDKLKYLKYLDLSYCRNLTSIPASIGNLVGLQTLKLKECEQLVFPTQVITMLINLRCFEFDECKAFEEKMPLGLGKLTSLQHISHFVVAKESDKCKRGTLNELKELNQIRGKLTIRNLGSVKDVQSESQDANLRGKQHIQKLKLFWGEENRNSDSLQLLKNLCPPQNLKRLTVDSFPGMRFSHWVSSLSNVVQISLSDFSSCEYLPPLESLGCLQTLKLEWMDKLKWIYYDENSSSFFPSLKTLSLNRCPELIGWQRRRRRRRGDYQNESHTDNHVSLPLSFSRLSHLEIRSCPSMTCMPTFPRLYKGLELHNCSVKALKDTCLVGDESCTLYPLSALRDLSIGDAEEIESMPEEWMQNLKSLHRLFVKGSSVIPALSRQLKHLPSKLQSLTMFEVDKLDVLWEHDEDGDCTRCQTSFYCLRSLQTLSFMFCRDMKVLPEQIIGKVQSLKHISITGCEELESLPESMHHLSNLQTLEIRRCPMLRERCKAETGQDWPKIAHIPNIQISE